MEAYKSGCSGRLPMEFLREGRRSRSAPMVVVWWSPTPHDSQTLTRHPPRKHLPLHSRNAEPTASTPARRGMRVGKEPAAIGGVEAQVASFFAVRNEEQRFLRSKPQKGSFSASLIISIRGGGAYVLVRAARASRATRSPAPAPGAPAVARRRAQREGDVGTFRGDCLRIGAHPGIIHVSSRLRKNNDFRVHAQTR